MQGVYVPEKAPQLPTEPPYRMFSIYRRGWFGRRVLVDVVTGHYVSTQDGAMTLTIVVGEAQFSRRLFAPGEWSEVVVSVPTRAELDHYIRARHAEMLAQQNELRAEANRIAAQERYSQITPGEGRSLADFDDDDNPTKH